MNKTVISNTSSKVHNLSTCKKTPCIKPILDVTDPSAFDLYSSESNSVLSHNNYHSNHKSLKKSIFYREGSKKLTTSCSLNEKNNKCKSHLRSHTNENLCAPNSFLINYYNNNNCIEYDSSYDYDEEILNQEDINNIINNNKIIEFDRKSNESEKRCSSFDYINFEKENNNININNNIDNINKNNINNDIDDNNNNFEEEDEEGYNILNMLAKIKKTKKL